MSCPTFNADHPLIQAVDRCVDSASDELCTAALRKTLCNMIRAGELQLPEEVFQTVDGHYARRELYQSERYGYSMVAMTWGPGQGTPIHDHSGMWCVEGVIRGTIEVIQYEMTGCSGERFRFEERGCIQAGEGSAGSLLPPHEYHTIANPSDQEIAVSLHIYKGEMCRCAVFSPEGDDWYRRNWRELGLD
jgi:predicted metal-dependent enzyme (double-stranded beta helix superfamily)